MCNRKRCSNRDSRVPSAGSTASGGGSSGYWACKPVLLVPAPLQCRVCPSAGAIARCHGEHSTQHVEVLGAQSVAQGRVEADAELAEEEHPAPPLRVELPDDLHLVCVCVRVCVCVYVYPCLSVYLYVYRVLDLGEKDSRLAIALHDAGHLGFRVWG